MSSARLIPLTQGLFALVDSDDHPRLMRYRWQAVRSGKGWYASRGVYDRSAKRSYPLSMHRALLDSPSGVEVDHKNRDGLDNRRSNLRLATRSQNTANSPHRANGMSGYRGVTFQRPYRRWAASIESQGCRIHLGNYATAEEAALAYDKGAREVFGEFAYQNFGGLEVDHVPTDIECTPITDDQIRANAIELKRRFAVMRKANVKPCRQCGKIMVGVQERRTTCSPSCRTALWAARKRED